MGYCQIHNRGFSGDECPRCPPLPPSEHRKPEEKIPPCPRCGTNKYAYADGERDYWCAHCKVAYDGSDDGDVGYAKPETIAARHERYEQRQLEGKRR